MPPLPCSELEWQFSPGIHNNNSAVCATSKIENECYNTDSSSVVLADGICREAGGRLCTLEEVNNDFAQGTGCQLDTRFIWTSTPCGDQSFYVARGKYQALSPPICVPAWSSAYNIRCCADAMLAEGESNNSTNTTSEDCHDIEDSERCSLWAISGYCSNINEGFHAYMAQNCARTCGTCAGVNTTVSVVEELEVINGLAVLPTSDVFTMTIRYSTASAPYTVMLRAALRAASIFTGETLQINARWEGVLPNHSGTIDIELTTVGFGVWLGTWTVYDPYVFLFTHPVGDSQSSARLIELNYPLIMPSEIPTTPSPTAQRSTSSSTTTPEAPITEAEVDNTLTILYAPSEVPRDVAFAVTVNYLTRTYSSTISLRAYLRATSVITSQSVQIGPRYDWVLSDRSGTMDILLTGAEFSAWENVHSVRCVIYMFPTGNDQASTRLVTTTHPMQSPPPTTLTTTVPTVVTETTSTMTTTTTALDQLSVITAPEEVPTGTDFRVTLAYTTRAEPNTATLRAYFRVTEVESGSSIQVGPRIDVGLTRQTGLLHIRLSGVGFEQWNEVINARIVVYIFPSGNDTPSTRMVTVVRSIGIPVISPVSTTTGTITSTITTTSTTIPDPNPTTVSSTASRVSSTTSEEHTTTVVSDTSTTDTTTTPTMETTTTTTTTGIDRINILFAPDSVPHDTEFIMTVDYSTRAAPNTATLRGYLRATSIVNGATVQVGPRADIGLTSRIGQVFVQLSGLNFQDWASVRDLRMVLYIFPTGNDNPNSRLVSAVQAIQKPRTTTTSSTTSTTSSEEPATISDRLTTRATTVSSTTNTRANLLEILIGPSVVPREEQIKITAGYQILAEPSTTQLRAYLLATSQRTGGSVQIGPRVDVVLEAQVGLVELQLSAIGFTAWDLVTLPRAYLSIFPIGEGGPDSLLATAFLHMSPPPMVTSVTTATLSPITSTTSVTGASGSSTTVSTSTATRTSSLVLTTLTSTSQTSRAVNGNLEGLEFVEAPHDAIAGDITITVRYWTAHQPEAVVLRAILSGSTTRSNNVVALSGQIDTVLPSLHGTIDVTIPVNLDQLRTANNIRLVIYTIRADSTVLVNLAYASWPILPPESVQSTTAAATPSPTNPVNVCESMQFGLECNGTSPLFETTEFTGSTGVHNLDQCTAYCAASPFVGCCQFDVVGSRCSAYVSSDAIPTTVSFRAAGTCPRSSMSSTAATTVPFSTVNPGHQQEQSTRMGSISLTTLSITAGLLVFLIIALILFYLFIIREGKGQDGKTAGVVQLQRASERGNHHQMIVPVPHKQGQPVLPNPPLSNVVSEWDLDQLQVPGQERSGRLQKGPLVSLEGSSMWDHSVAGGSNVHPVTMAHMFDAAFAGRLPQPGKQTVDYDPQTMLTSDDEQDVDYDPKTMLTSPMEELEDVNQRYDYATGDVYSDDGETINLADVDAASTSSSPAIPIVYDSSQPVLASSEYEEIPENTLDRRAMARDVKNEYVVPVAIHSQQGKQGKL